MAKETKNAAAEAAKKVATVANETNVLEVIDKGLVADTEVGESVYAEIQKEQDKETARQMMSRAKESMFSEEQGLLSVRKNRAEEKLALEKLTIKSRLRRWMCGFVVTEEIIKQSAKIKDDLFNKEEVNEKDKTMTILLKDGKTKQTFKIGEKVDPIIDYVDFDIMQPKARDYFKKKHDAVEAEFRTYTSKLQARYGDYWRCSWGF